MYLHVSRLQVFRSQALGIDHWPRGQLSVSGARGELFSRCLGIFKTSRSKNISLKVAAEKVI